MFPTLYFILYFKGSISRHNMCIYLINQNLGLEKVKI